MCARVSLNQVSLCNLNLVNCFHRLFVVFIHIIVRVTVCPIVSDTSTYLLSSPSSSSPSHFHSPPPPSLEGFDRQRPLRDRRRSQKPRRSPRQLQRCLLPLLHRQLGAVLTNFSKIVTLPIALLSLSLSLSRRGGGDRRL